MEQAFESLQKDGKNNTDNLITWIKESKIVDDSKASEDKVRNLFADASDSQNIGLSKFKEVIQKLAADQKKTVEEYTKMLSDQSSNLMDALSAGVSALKNAFK